MNELTKTQGPRANQMINLTTCWALQLNSVYYTPNFVGSFLLSYRTLYDLTKIAGP